ncbi:MAG TPA: hypothetical protein ENG55_00560 [Candidatus Omnitrophica bacterium]|nr:hypothetical protein [Candidatus Omnitrophota bacterium]
MKRIFLNNLILKVTSLILAIIMWFLISMELTARENIQRKVISDVEIGLLRPSKEEIFGPFKIKLDPYKVDLYIEGPKDEVENCTSSNITAFVDISDFAKEGIYSIPVKVILPDNIRLLSENPLCRVEISRYEEIE